MELHDLPLYTLATLPPLFIDNALRSSSATRPSDQRRCPWPGNALPGACRNSRRQRSNTLGLPSNPRATSASETPASSRRTAASLNSLVNCLRDNPMTQFSIHWILSLNRLCQKWGQVQSPALPLIQKQRLSSLLIND